MKTQQLYKKIGQYFENKPVRRVQVFGSYARGEQGSDSDIDLVLTFEQPIGLLTFSAYRLDLEKILGIPVDLTTENGISALALPFIKPDLTTIYEKRNRE